MRCFLKIFRIFHPALDQKGPAIFILGMIFCRAGGTGGARGAKAPPDFSRFNTVGIDQTLKPIKVFKYWPPQIFGPSAGTGLCKILHV